MPELPEVEALAEYLRERSTNRRIERAHLVAIGALKTYDPPLNDVVGLQLFEVIRHGKFLDIGLRDPAAGTAPPIRLVIHLARGGWLRYLEQVPTAPPRLGKGPLAFRCVFDDGSGFDLTEAGTTKRLAVYVVPDAGEVPGVARLGPDALSITAEEFAAVLAGQRAQIKGVLTHQSLVSGVGNAYSDEILHAAKLSPFAIAAKLDASEVARLYTAMRDILSDAVRRSVGMKAAELKGEKRSGLQVHARTGLPCPVCQTAIREVSFADKSLQYCPTCQTGGRILADRRLSRLLK